MTGPLISVIMPVYNGERHLNEAIDSILNQTFNDFEFIILNDGSTDKSEEIILSYVDSRIRYFKNETNLQIVRTLNKGLSLAKGKYIARMDADDVSLPHRLNEQFEYMESHPDIAVCGSYLQILEYPQVKWKVPEHDEEIRPRLLFESCLFHPTVIYKREINFNSQESYDSSFLGAEDYDLWERLSENPEIHFANIPEVLLLYRVHPNDNRVAYKAKQQKLANLIRHRQLRNLGLAIAEQTFSLHKVFSYSDVIISLQLADLKLYQQWLDKIEQANNQHSLYSPVHLKKELEYRWLKFCLQAALQQRLIIFTFLLSHWSPKTLGSIYHATRILWRSCKRKH